MTSCGTLGHPSPDNSLRLYTKSECDQLNGTFYSDKQECHKKTGGSYSYDCRNLNTTTSTTSSSEPESSSSKILSEIANNPNILAAIIISGIVLIAILIMFFSYRRTQAGGSKRKGSSNLLLLGIGAVAVFILFKGKMF